MATSQQPPPRQPPQGAPPGSAPTRPPPGQVPPPAPLPGPPAPAAAHAADLERRIRRRSWVAAIAIIIALAAAGVALYLAIDTRDNSATKDDLQELQQPKASGVGDATVGGLVLAAQQAHGDRSRASSPSR